MDQDEVYIIPALGRSISLGSLYDARSEKFTMTSILNRKNIDEVIELKDATATYCDFVSSDSYDEKFQNLNINGALKLSFLSDSITGTVKLEFLNNEKKTNKVVKSTLFFKVRTKVETLQISNENMKNYITDNLECESNATHYVTEIKWGANVFATFELETSKISDENTFKAEAEAKVVLSDNLQYLASILGSDLSEELGVKASNQTSFQEKSFSTFNRFKIKFEGDVPISKIPQNMDDVVKLLKCVPEDIKNAMMEKEYK